MTDRSNLIFVNANGDRAESAVGDSLKYASYKTANYELTDTLLGKLANPVQASAGVADAGKYPVLNADGKIDPTMIDESAFEWQNSVKAIQTDATLNPGSTPTLGDRYILTDVAHLHANFGTISGVQDDDIVEWNGTAFVVAYRPTVGSGTTSDADAQHWYLYSGTAWVAKSTTELSASLGVKLVGSDIRADLLALGGLALSSNSVFVDTDNASIEKNGTTGKLQVKPDGINDTHIDFGTGTNQVSAVDLPIADAGGYTTQTEVEGALQELYAAVANGLEYVCAANVNKGDLLYFSADDQVSKMPINAAHESAGIALATKSSGASVGTKSCDRVLTGVLSGATRDQKVYWTGTALSLTMPATAGSHVWKAGVAKNATDMLIEVEFIKKNA